MIHKIIRLSFMLAVSSIAVITACSPIATEGLDKANPVPEDIAREMAKQLSNPVYPQNELPLTEGDIQMAVTINGMEKGDEAALQLSVEALDTTEPLIAVQTVLGDGTAGQATELNAKLKDGYYQIVIQAPDRYFRDPKGYLFQIYQSKIVNPAGRPIVFNLVPPENQRFRPYRGTSSSAEVADNTDVPDSTPRYMLESMISLSGPIKQPDSQ